MIHLTYVPPQNLSDSDLTWLDKFARRWSYTGETAEDFIRKAFRNQLLFLRISGDADGLIGLEPLNKKTGRELWIEVFVGKGLKENVTDAWAALIETAQQMRADKLRISTSRPGLEKVLEMLELKRIAVIFGEDFEYG